MSVRISLRAPAVLSRAQRHSSIATPTAEEFFFPRKQLDAEASAVREEAFFASIRLRNGTYKTTYPHRLDDLNEIVNDLLPANRPLEIMDVAVSSGVATLEWMESLQKEGIAFKMTAGDLCFRAFLLSFGPFLNVLVDRTGYPLQFDILGRGIAYPPGRRVALRYLPVFVGIHAVRWVLPFVLAAASKQLVAKPDGSSARQFGIGCRRAVLISPRLLEQESLTILDDDLLSPGSFEHRFHVIRAANILNKSYFSDETLRTMVANLLSRLGPQGVLAVCRTHDDGVNHGTVFRLNQAREFEVVSRIGQGSEIEDLVVAHRGGDNGRMKQPPW